MKNLTPKITEKTKKSQSAELSDDMLDNVSGGAEQLRGGNSPSSKPSSNVTDELSDDALDKVSGGEGIIHPEAETSTQPKQSDVSCVGEIVGYNYEEIPITPCIQTVKVLHDNAGKITND